MESFLRVQPTNQMTSKTTWLIKFLAAQRYICEFCHEDDLIMPFHSIWKKSHRINCTHTSKCHRYDFYRWELPYTNRIKWINWVFSLNKIYWTVFEYKLEFLVGLRLLSRYSGTYCSHPLHFFCTLYILDHNLTIIITNAPKILAWIYLTSITTLLFFLNLFAKCREYW